jgi:hypothetical protein
MFQPIRVDHTEFFQMDIWKIWSRSSLVLKYILVGTELILFCGPRYFGIWRERTRKWCRWWGWNWVINGSLTVITGNMFGPLSWCVLCSNPDVRYLSDGSEGRFLSRNHVFAWGTVVYMLCPFRRSYSYSVLSTHWIFGHSFIVLRRCCSVNPSVSNSFSHNLVTTSPQQSKV